MSAFQPAPKDLVEVDLSYVTQNIIVGNGEVPTIQHRGGLMWALPGGGKTRNIVEAYQMAKRLDEIITPNLHPFRRTLMRK